MDNGKHGSKRTLVIPGEVVSDGDLKAGKNTYRRDNKIYATQMGFKTVTSNYVNVIPLGGRYMPRPDDLVIGVIASVSPTSWLVEINSPYPAPLHVNEVPWRVDFGDTTRYLNTGDSILARVFMVDEINRVQVTMKDQGSRKLSGGQIIEISPSKVPRIIGKGGSMISMIKQKTMCRLFVGQNGRIWIDGEPEKIKVAVDAIQFIEAKSHKFGLTESVEHYLDRELNRKSPDEVILPEIISMDAHKEPASEPSEPSGETPSIKEPEVSAPQEFAPPAPITPDRLEPKQMDGQQVVTPPPATESTPGFSNVPFIPQGETPVVPPAPLTGTPEPIIPRNLESFQPPKQEGNIEEKEEEKKEHILKNEEFERMND